MFKVDLGGGAELRPLEPWQAEEFLAHIDRARATVDPWIPWASRSTDLASARQTLQRYADLQARGEGRILGIRLDGVLVGGVMAFDFDEHSGVCEVGCWLEPAGTGRGLITKSAALLIEWLIRDRSVYRVEWHCRPDNVASSAVARRLGLKHEATLRANFVWKGVRYDTEIWAVLAPEWPGIEA
ncbi:GNAT family N-acetyltransferase [Actinoplanes sp. LDG1-06]|uniref:GNAT family N-acetyltransferase n=1 Tax=Paractinoplanes ovalisporus TaxID=2810368 RepID=A0ABS2AUH9_9ACTN|nr:GNAT family protein [Actinoplanes ovalisporus]MBM2622834.1 GNAT family N-acetyltransferase [Actinoplanes ovalisporus]